MSEQENKGKKKISKRFLIVLILLVLVLGSFGAYKYVYSLSHERTDNAQIVADVSPVIPHASGYIEKVFVEDDQYVKKGDTLLIIDAREYRLKLASAQAALAIAESTMGVSEGNLSYSQSQIRTANASFNSTKTSIESAKVRVWRANKDYDRYANLLKENVITEQQFEQAKAEKEMAENQLKLIEEQSEVANSQKGASEIESKVVESQLKVSQARIDQAKAAVDEAELNLSYCIVTAAADGQVSSVQIVEGQLISAGQPLFNIVLNNDLWVVANFKETQIEKMQPGQEVEIEIDAFPGTAYKGRLGSISPGTGALFTLLPPDNSTGNFVKIVQRVPVKILFENNDAEAIKKLRPGLSANVTVVTK